LRIKENVGERGSYYFSIYIYEERSYIALKATRTLENKGERRREEELLL
jgi:hypothetical protein